MDEQQRLRVHYELEKKLAERIRSSSASNRKEVTLAAYRELYQKLPWHVSRNKSEEELFFEEEFKASFLHPLVQPDFKVLELGCGSGKTIISLSGRIREGIGIDATLVKAEQLLPPNIRLLEDDVRSIALKDDDFDLIFSFHLIEHLHPDDLPTHIRSIFEHLKKGGRLFLLTPHAITGPHDVSKHFDDVATGFHLKEYTYADLAKTLRDAGFTRLRSQVLPRRLVRSYPVAYWMGVRNIVFQTILERAVGAIPSRGLQRRIGKLVRLTDLISYATKP